MRNIEEQLQELPEEFPEEMERQRNERWADVFIYVARKYKCVNEIKQMQDNGVPIMSFLRSFYDMGFFSGVNFALDPGEPYRDTGYEYKY